MSVCRLKVGKGFGRTPVAAAGAAAATDPEAAINKSLINLEK